MSEQERHEWRRKRDEKVLSTVEDLTPFMREDLLYQIDVRGIAPYQAYREVLENNERLVRAIREKLGEDLTDIYLDMKRERQWAI